MAEQNGFSIIEIIISIFIIGVMLICYGMANKILVMNQEIGFEEIALRIARSEIENLRALDYALLPPSGAFSDPLLASLPQGAGTITVADFNSETKSVSVTVSWQEPASGVSRNVSLATVINEFGL